MMSLLYKTAAKMGGLIAALKPHRPGVIVLIYHSISGDDDVITVPPALFQEQMRWLKDHYQVVSLDAALNQRYDEDVVVLTFDDGYTDYKTNAVPYLIKQGLPSTVYAITEYVLDPGKPFAFSSGAGKKSMSRADLLDLAREPLVTIGSHTHTHRRLVGVGEEELHHELKHSHTVLGNILGQSNLHFCYPWGVYDGKADIEVRQYFRSAVTGQGGKNISIQDPYVIKRIPVRRENIPMFQHRVRGNLFLEDQVRRLKNRIKYGGRL